MGREEKEETATNARYASRNARRKTVAMAVTTRSGAKKTAAASSFLELLPREMVLEVAKHVHESEALAFVLTCKAFRDAREEALKEQEKKSKRKGASQKLKTVYYYHFNSR